jgi:hypothetical protein
MHNIPDRRRGLDSGRVKCVGVDVIVFAELLSMLLLLLVRWRYKYDVSGE